MSRIANKPIELPSGVEVTLSGLNIKVKGPKGQLERELHPLSIIKQDGNILKVEKADDEDEGGTTRRGTSSAIAGTTRAVVSNMVVGVSEGFEKALTLIGVGYRAQMKGKALGLTLGLSHPVEYPIPEGITVETPSQTEVVIKGCDKQKVGQVAAEIREFRPPEPYKGKGIRYKGEYISLKETKKK